MRRLFFAAALACLVCRLGIGTSLRADEPEPDPRLEQKVTVDAVATPLQDVLADLSRKTGVSLTLHRNLENQKVTVLLDEQPLYIVMNNLRDLLDALWFTEEVKGETGYYLKQKHGWQQYAARLRAQRTAEKERREAEFRDRVREIARTAGLPREDLLAMLESDPGRVRDALYYSSWIPEGLTDYWLPGAVAVMSGLSGAQLDAVFGATPLQVAYNDLPLAGRAIVDQVCEWIAAHPEHRLHDAFWGRDPGLLSVAFQRQQCGTTLLSQGPRNCVSIWLVGSQPRVSLFLTEVGEPLAAPASQAWLRVLPSALGLSEAQLRQRLGATEAGRALLTPPEPAAASPQAAGRRDLAALYKGLEEDDVLDLELTKELGLGRGESGSVPFECMLEAVHRKGGMQLVADSYVTLSGEGCDVIPKPPDLMPTVLAESFGRAWTRDGDIFSFRSKTWYDDDVLDPPVWLIKRLQAKVKWDEGKRTRTFDFDLEDFAAAYTALSDEQIEAVDAAYRGPNPYYDGILNVAGYTGAGAATLRLCGSLDATQRQKLRGEGIGVGDLATAQQAAFADCLVRAFKRELPPPQVAAATMRLAREVTEGRHRSQKWTRRRAVFTFALAGGKEEKVSILLASMPVEGEAETSRHAVRAD